MADLGILTIVAALNRKVIVIEAVIGAIIIVLLVAILVMSARRKKRATTSQAPPTDFYADLRQQPSGQADPFAAFAASAAPAAPANASNGAPAPAAPTAPDTGVSAEAALAQGTAPAYSEATPGHDDGAGAPRAEADGFASYGAHAAHAPDAVAAATGYVGSSWPASEPAPQALVVDPPPGTPAGWLPDPGGAPDTLRYWDGNAWTPHFAQRS